MIDLRERDEVYPNLFVGRQSANLDDVDAVAVVFPKMVWPAWVLVDVFEAPLTDDAWEIVAGDVQRAETVAHWIVDNVRRNKRVLAMCKEGLNRSAWVAALAICKLTGCSGQEAVDRVQKARPGSLYNIHFQRYLQAIIRASPGVRK